MKGLMIVFLGLSCFSQASAEPLQLHHGNEDEHCMIFHHGNEDEHK